MAFPLQYLLCSLFLIPHAKRCEKTHPDGASEGTTGFLPCCQTLLFKVFEWQVGKDPEIFLKAHFGVTCAFVMVLFFDQVAEAASTQSRSVRIACLVELTRQSGCFLNWL